MTTLLLEQLWIHDADNLADNLALFVLDEGETRAAAVANRRYAGGRQRAVSAPGVTRTIPLALRSVAREDYLRLCQLIDEARLVMIRLPRGRKLWGTFAGLTSTEHRRVDRVDAVTLTLTEVTHVEGV